MIHAISKMYQNGNLQIEFTKPLNNFILFLGTACFEYNKYILSYRIDICNWEDGQLLINFWIWNCTIKNWPREAPASI